MSLAPLPYPRERGDPRRSVQELGPFARCLEDGSTFEPAEKNAGALLSSTRKGGR
jgi:hypothetical protein